MDNERVFRTELDMIVWAEILRVIPELEDDTRVGTVSANVIQPIINHFAQAGWKSPEQVEQELDDAYLQMRLANG
jgi:hypothetical protein